MTQPNNGPLIDVGDLFFQFTREGDTIDGQYLGYQPIVWPDGNPGKQHFIDTGQGVYKFTGTFNLDNSLDMVEPGAYTVITYKGAQPTRRGLNPVKVFTVQTAQTRALPAAAPHPAQARLPFTVGGMPQTAAAPPAADVSAHNAPELRQTAPASMGGADYDSPTPGVPADAPPRQVLQYLPDGTPVFGFTPDGSPLDAYGRLIAVNG